MSCEDIDVEIESGMERDGKRRRIEDTSAFLCRDSNLIEDSCVDQDHKGDSQVVRDSKLIEGSCVDQDHKGDSEVVRDSKLIEGSGSCVDQDQKGDSEVVQEDADSCTGEDVRRDMCVDQDQKGDSELVQEDADLCTVEDVGRDVIPDAVDDKDEKLRISREIDVKKKLLVLDINGLLADVVSEKFASDDYKADIVMGMKAVFKRPHSDDFLQFCFERFNVGIWSSRTEKNVNIILDLLLGGQRSKLVFCWDQSHCTHTGFYTIDNQRKPLVLKELKKLWEKGDPSLPWNIGDFDESNTLLLDDSPYKGLRNPPNTSIYPNTYQYKNLDDDSLGPKGDLRAYLEGLSLAHNVQQYVEHNPYGQPPITESNPSWHFYAKVKVTDFAKQEMSSCQSKNQNEKASTTVRSSEKLTVDQNFESIACSSKDITIQLEEKAYNDIQSDNRRTQSNERKTQYATKDLVQLSSKMNQQWNCTSGRTREARYPRIQRSLSGRNREVFRKKKLLILDVNGLLADFVSYEPYGFKAHSRLGDKAVFIRPYCDDFLHFCFEKFYIGFWMTTTRKNAQCNLDLLLGWNAKNVLFSWDISHCSITNSCTLERSQPRDRHIYFKELRKVWEADETNLPWGRYKFNQSNTLLVDNFPHSALPNPPHTAIFPPRYRFKDASTDNTLGPEGDLRLFLEEIAVAENVQEYVRNNPYGQSPISHEHPFWNYYVDVLKETKAHQNRWSGDWWTPTSLQRNEQSVEHSSLEKLKVDQNVVLTECSSRKPFENCGSIHQVKSAISDTRGLNPTTQTNGQKLQSEKKDLVRLSVKTDQQVCSAGCVTVVTSREPPAPWMPHSSLRNSHEVSYKKKLLILDVNGLLADFVSNYDTNVYKEDSFLGNKSVFKRPYCDDFLNFCFDKFYIGFWLTTTRRNAQYNLNFFLGNAINKVLFSWDISHCTEPGAKTLERRVRPILMKELEKVWENDLLRRKFKFDPSNTLLVDNYPCTALMNPPHTAIFPPRYQYMNEKTDDSLGPGGDLRVFLEGLVLADNVQDYVKHNSFGQTPISDEIPAWNYYAEVIEGVKASRKLWSGWEPEPPRNDYNRRC